MDLGAEAECTAHIINGNLQTFTILPQLFAYFFSIFLLEHDSSPFFSVEMRHFSYSSFSAFHFQMPDVVILLLSLRIQAKRYSSSPRQKPRPINTTCDPGAYYTNYLHSFLHLLFFPTMWLFAVKIINVLKFLPNQNNLVYWMISAPHVAAISFSSFLLLVF